MGWWLQLLARAEPHRYRQEALNFVVRDHVWTEKPHSHPDAAKQRNEVTVALQEHAQKQGLVPYHVTMGRKETGDGYHVWHWAKDTAVMQHNDAVLGHHFVMCIDADYYGSGPKRWAEYGRPMAFYTHAPRRLAGQTNDATYYIDGDDQLVTEVSGGGVYKHQLWAYNSDVMVFDYWWGSRVYYVDMMELEHDHLVVFFSPMTTIYSPIGNLVAGSRLQRRRFLGRCWKPLIEFWKLGVPCYMKSNFAMQYATERVNGKVKRFVSIAPVGSAVSAYLTEAGFYAMRSSFGKGITNTSAPAICDLLKKTCLHLSNDELNYMSRIVQDYLLELGEVTESRIVCGAPAPSYISVFKGKDAVTPFGDSDCKDLSRYVSAPLVSDPSLVPGKCKSNDSAAIVGRVDKVRNIKNPTSGKMYEWRQEFIDLMFEESGVTKHSLVPYDLEYVVKKKSVDPVKRGRIQKMLHSMGAWASELFIVKSFVKKECYVKINDPRNICTNPIDHGLLLARYTLMFGDTVSKKLPWYMPARSPEQIAQAHVDAAQSGDAIIEMDGVRFDGSQDEFQNETQTMTLSQGLHPDYLDEYLELRRREVYSVGVTSSGERWEVGTITQSGNEDTTRGNTKKSGLFDYCRLRKQGFSKYDSWKRLLAACGDDLNGRTPHSQIPEALKAITWVANQLGVTYEYAVRKKGDPVSFLSREFPNLWFGCKGSIQSPYRTISKLHLTVAPKNIPIGNAMVDKANGLLTLDPVNELAVAYAGALKRVAQDYYGARYVTGGKEDLTYWQRRCLEEGWASWPQLTFREWMEYYTVQLGITPMEITSYIHILNNVKHPDGLGNLKPLVFRVMEHKPGLVTNDNFYALPVNDELVSGSNTEEVRKNKEEFEALNKVIVKQSLKTSTDSNYTDRVKEFHRKFALHTTGVEKQRKAANKRQGYEMFPKRKYPNTLGTSKGTKLEKV